MIRNRPIFASLLFLFFIIVSILIWRASLLFNNLSSMLPETETNLEVKQKTKKIAPILMKNLNTLSVSSDKGNLASYETIDQTIARIKRDVIVTGVVTGTPGQESALFQIEGMPDQSFNINTQLMEGFIITEITQNQVVLKNQSGDEFFSMYVQSGNLSESIETDQANTESAPVDETNNPTPNNLSQISNITDSGMLKNGLSTEAEATTSSQTMETITLAPITTEQISMKNGLPTESELAESPSIENEISHISTMIEQPPMKNGLPIEPE